MSEEQTTDSSQTSADQIFNQFCDSNDFREILHLFKALCSQIGIDPNQQDGFYPTIKKALTSWKASSLFQLLDSRASQSVYNGGSACAGRRVLVVGAGPVGLRGAIELAMLGARVDLVEKRLDFQRNNSLHLWPFLITDLRNLGAKKFYGKFASGSIEHICIRILQAILLKVCLLLGVKVHAGITFSRLVEPKSSTGWRVEVSPCDQSLGSHDYDVIIGADGKKNSLPGFKTKEFRAKLALAITVNFVNHNTQQENSVPEIGGVAFVYKQDFFNNLSKTHGIELENIVYYKDETHYFVMTVRKQSLLKKRVLKQDFNDPKQLLSVSNIDRGYLQQYALEATHFATEGGLGEVEFEKNHRGENDVALFDFTSLFAAENAARIVERKGKKLLLCLAGDSLIEPFWPTGSGCARGFLGVFDNAWMIRKFCQESASPIELIEERESILYLLPQTTPYRLSSNFSSYTIDPKTRYLNLSELVPPGDVSHLYDTDNQNAVKIRPPVQPPTQDKPKPAVEEKVVEPTIKRSKSSEVLSSEASSAVANTTQQETAEITRADLKSFWQNQQSLKSSDKTQGKQKQAKTEPKVSKTDSKVPKEKKVVNKTASKAVAPVTAKPPLSPKRPASPASRDPPLSKFSPLRHTIPKPQREPPTKPPSSPKEKKSVKKPESNSPRLSRLLLGARARSASPEHAPQKSSPKIPKKHQLQVSSSLKSLDREAENEAGQTNVLDIIKKYDLRAESITASKPTQSETRPSVKPQKESGKKEPKKPSSSKAKKSKDEPKTPKESKGGFFSNLFKSGKSYDVAAASSNDKAKKRSTPEPEAEKSNVKKKIDQLKKISLMTDGCDENDAVLLSVSPLDQEETQTDQDNKTDVPEETIDPVAMEEPSMESSSPTHDSVVGQEDSSGMVGEDVSDDDEAVKDEIADRVKALKAIFSPQHQPVSRHLSFDTKRSKEIDLSEVLGRKTESPGSHPLWLARVIQGLSRCLEQLRKDNDILTAKTALEILNTIISNVQAHPDSDVYRRVRVSSESFSKKVWQLPPASQFLARAGWVQIEDFIVLPMDAKVENAKRTLEKHLNIVNQMLWSRQLELPSSSQSSVVKRPPKHRNRAASLMRRESYATMLVNDTLQRVEEDTAMITDGQSPSQSPDLPSQSPDLPSQSPDLPSQSHENTTTTEEEPSSDSEVPVNKVSETQQTMLAASAARNIWKNRSSSAETRRDVTSSYILERELYDLPLPKAKAVSASAPAGDKRPAVSETTDGPSSQADTVIIERLKRLNTSLSKKATNHNNGSTSLRADNSSNQPTVDTPNSDSSTIITANIDGSTVLAAISDGSTVTADSGSLSPDQDEWAESDDVCDQLVASPVCSDQSESESKPQSPVPTDNTSPSVSPRPTSPVVSASSSARSEQLRQLLGRPISPSTRDQTTEPQPKPTTDAQYSTGSSIHNERVEYGNMTMEAAAQTRQKWLDTEASLTTEPVQKVSAEQKQGKNT